MCYQCDNTFLSNITRSCCAHFSLALRIQVIAEFANFNPSRPDDGRREKTELNFFYFHTSLWFLQRFYEG